MLNVSSRLPTSVPPCLCGSLKISQNPNEFAKIKAIQGDSRLFKVNQGSDSKRGTYGGKPGQAREPPKKALPQPLAGLFLQTAICLNRLAPEGVAWRGNKP
jgi:hypothetical protein